jgi:hypothetical protein
MFLLRSVWQYNMRLLLRMVKSLEPAIIDDSRRIFVTLVALVVSIIVSTGSFAWGFASAEFTVFVDWVLIFGAVWLFTQWRGWNWFSSLALLVAVLVSVLGLWFGLSIEWFVSGTIFALFAWDMSDFRQHMRTVIVDDGTRAMERRHIARVSLLSLAGLILVSVVLLLRRQFTSEWGILLAIVAVLEIGQLIGWIKR